MNPHQWIAARHFLYQNPELSDNELTTTQYIVEFLQKLGCYKLVLPEDKKGVIALYTQKNSEKTIAFRGDIDAIQVSETKNLLYKSVNEGIAHKCGHDGHTTILLALASLISKEQKINHNIVLIFQPAEEIGTGAEKMIRILEQYQIRPNYIIGFHNIPGFPLHEIIFKQGCFAAASAGLTISLTGKQTHAAQPEKGINPAMAVASIIQKMDALNHDSEFADFILTTPIGIKMGEKAFGTSAGYAELYFTLRSFQDEDMSLLKTKIERFIHQEALNYELSFQLEWQDRFPATANKTILPKCIMQAAQANKLSIKTLNQPFRWSEDFAHYLFYYPGIFIGIGSGEQCKPLHDPEYDFPDELLKTIPYFLKDICKLIL